MIKSKILFEKTNVFCALNQVQSLQSFFGGFNHCLNGDPIRPRSPNPPGAPLRKTAHTSVHRGTSAMFTAIERFHLKPVMMFSYMSSTDYMDDI